MNVRSVEDEVDHVIAFSLDYDGTADLFSSAYKNFYSNYKNGSNLIDDMRAMFMSYLSGIINKVKDAYSADKNIVVMIYSGSARYDCNLDQLGMQQNRNGSCFDTLSILCEENDWIFNPFLFVDNCHHLKPGTGMSNPKFIIPPEKYDKTKVKMIDAQAENLKLLYPDVPIELHFIDDDACGHGIMLSLIDHFSTRNLAGINLHLHQYARDDVAYISQMSSDHNFNLAEYCEIVKRCCIPALITRHGPVFPTVKDADGYDSKMRSSAFFKPVKDKESDGCLLSLMRMANE